MQGEAPARINQEVPSWTRSLEKLPGHPGTPLHLSPTIRETVPHSLCSARVIAAAWGPPHLGLTQNSNWDQASGGGWQGQPLGQSPAHMPSTFLRAGGVQATNPQEATGSGRFDLGTDLAEAELTKVESADKRPISPTS